MNRIVRSRRSSANRAPLAVAVLAGGRSERMGRDKAQLRLNGRTLLAYAQAAGRALGCPVRVVRRDLVPRCGPLGGVFTALNTCDAEAVVFLACDMPWVSAELLRELVRGLGARRPVVFVALKGVVGFPFALRVRALPVVAAQIERGEFSLQALAGVLRAKRIEAAERAGELLNINTPEELATARRRGRARTPARR